MQRHEPVHDPAAASGSRLILFVDDHDVLYRPGTVRRLRPLDRHPANPVVPDDKPWEGAIGYCSVYRDPTGGAYQLWYQAAPGCRLCYARSDDGIMWEKPEIGADRSNTVLTVGYGAGVVVDPQDENSERRYKLAFWQNNGTCVAFSPDGVHWKKHEPLPLLRGSFGRPDQPPYDDDNAYGFGLPLRTSDVNDPAYDFARRRYMLYAKTWIDGPTGEMFFRRAVVRCDSEDFLHWSTPQLVMAPDEIDGWGAVGGKSLAGGGSLGVHLHSGPTFCYNGMYFSLLQVIQGDSSGEMPIELATSRDGYAFERPFRRRMFLPVTHSRDDFDGGVIWSNATPVVLEDEIRFYYGAYSGTWGSERTLITHPTGVGLATMPRDRFAGLRPENSGAQITTRPLDFTDCSGLSVNADAEGGLIRVELLTEEGRRVRGHDAENAVTLRDDNLRHDVRWKDRRIADLPNGRYLVRIHLERAEVYALNLRYGL